MCPFDKYIMNKPAAMKCCFNKCANQDNLLKKIR